MIYWDHNASTPPAPEVIAAMTQCLHEHAANASAKHPAGQAARRRLEQARAQVAALAGARPRELVFTSGASEANAQVLYGLAQRMADREPPLLLISAIEHAAFLKLARELERQNRLRVQELPVDRDGRVSLGAAREQIRAGVALVSVMAANNETGVLQPVAELAALAHAAGALMHVDATQVLGRLPFDFAALGADLASVSAHKLHGPKGIGALLIRDGLVWPALVPGSQERARRGGTENLPGIVGFGVAAELARAQMAAAAPRQQALRDALEARLSAQLPIRVFGAGAERLPNTSCMAIAGLHAEVLLPRLERAQLMAAAGAACSSGAAQASHVLRAMGVDEAQALGALRFSLSRDSHAAELDAAIAIIVAAAAPRAAA